MGCESTLPKIRATNGDNNSFVDYSAVAVTDASGNLSGFSTGSSLVTARAALAAVAGRPTQVARYIYAVGGYTASAAMPLNTVEAASTGLDGTLGKFNLLTVTLPKALSFLSVVNVGRFL